jgi:hypothetical protein
MELLKWPIVYAARNSQTAEKSLYEAKALPRVCYELLRKWVRGKGVQTSRTAHATDAANLW